MGAIFLALKRQTELGTPPGCQRHFTRPHGTGRVLDAESGLEGVESFNKVGQRGRAMGAVPSAEEADSIWNDARVPASLHETA